MGFPSTINGGYKCGFSSCNSDTQDKMNKMIMKLRRSLPMQQL